MAIYSVGDRSSFGERDIRLSMEDLSSFGEADIPGDGDLGQYTLYFPLKTVSVNDDSRQQTYTLLGRLLKMIVCVKQDFFCCVCKTGLFC